MVKFGGFGIFLLGKESTFMEVRVGLLLAIFIVNIKLLSGQVNAYAKVTSIAGSTLNLSNVDESFDTFETGEQVLIMQMQDSVIGESTNVSTFGSLGSILSAGLFEIRVIASVTESGGTPTSITISGGLTNTYNDGSNTSIQLVSFPTLDDGGGDFTTTSNITALDWDGDVGGVVAFNVDSTLTLNHNITADGAGFVGGTANTGASVGCTPFGNYSVSAQDNHANKGEGVFNSTSSFHVAGRGRILSGGGGGNSHNAGGAGGGNYTAGGDGGPGWVCSPVAGGIGGLALSAHISASRVFLGGGGGAGEGNNNAATPGADGGGIILLSANELVTTGACAGRRISANGNSIAGNSSNDGSGGGGAGGSIVFQVAQFNVVAGCPLTNEASGGDGGDVNSGAQHGGGGGGGQGVIFYSTAAPSTNITTTTNNGSGGCNDNSSPCSNPASTGSGTSGTGIFGPATGPLPVTLVKFHAYAAENSVQLEWMTASEINNDYFLVQRSFDAVNWEEIAELDGHGNSTAIHSYDYIDDQPVLGTSYYRLKQVDFNGDYEYSEIRAVEFTSSKFRFSIYPNPANESIRLVTSGVENKSNNFNIRISNLQGIEVINQTVVSEVGNLNLSINIQGLLPGTYIVHITSNSYTKTTKLIKR